MRKSTHNPKNHSEVVVWLIFRDRSRKYTLSFFIFPSKLISIFDSTLKLGEIKLNHTIPCEMAFGIPRNFFLGIKVWIFTVNLDWEFLGIPKHKNSGSKKLEIPRNSQKFQVYSQQDLKFLRIPTNSNSENQWLSLKSCKSKKFLGISGNF